MGYESTLLVVENYGNVSARHGNRSYADVIATIDLCCMPYDFHHLVKDHWYDSECYVYIGNDEVFEDLYGAPLMATSLPIAISDLRKIDAMILDMDGERYRRLPPAIALLEGFDQSQWDELLVLHYGH